MVWSDITEKAWTTLIYEKCLENKETFIASELSRLKAKKVNSSKNLKQLQLQGLIECKWNLRLWIEFLENIDPSYNIETNFKVSELTENLDATTNTGLLNFYPDIQVRILFMPSEKKYLILSEFLGFTRRKLPNRC